MIQCHDLFTSQQKNIVHLACWRNGSCLRVYRLWVRAVLKGVSYDLSTTLYSYSSRIELVFSMYRTLVHWCFVSFQFLCNPCPEHPVCQRLSNNYYVRSRCAPSKLSHKFASLQHGTYTANRNINNIVFGRLVAARKCNCAERTNRAQRSCICAQYVY